MKTSIVAALVACLAAPGSAFCQARTDTLPKSTPTTDSSSIHLSAADTIQAKSTKISSTEKKAAKKDTIKINPEEKIAKAAKSIGRKTAQIASKSAAKISDKKFKSKTGPQGQTIYIDNESNYYYVDSKGKRIYLTREELKDKP